MEFQPTSSMAGQIALDYMWPWIGLGAAGVLLVLLLATDLLRSDLSVPRWRDLVWLAWAGTCAYLIHQFEEHGIDVKGQAYAFRASLCATLGFPESTSCPIVPRFITAVNIPAVWIAGPISALLGRRWPVIALSFFSVPFANAFAHLAAAVAQGTYNPGLLSAIVLFVPLSLWAFAVALQKLPGIGVRAVLATMLAGVAVHGVLLGSIFAYVRGWIGFELLVLIQILNPALPAIIVFLAIADRCDLRRRPA
jgi:hypothetical protein